MQARLTASCSDFVTLRAANDNIENSRDVDCYEWSTLSAWVFELKAELKAFCALHFDLGNAVRERDG